MAEVFVKKYNASGGHMAIASLMSGSSVSILTMQAQLRQQRAQLLARDQASTRLGFTQKTNAEKQIAGKWAALQPEMAQAVAYLGDLVDRVEVIRNYAHNLLNIEYNTRTATGATFTKYVQNFDATLRNINSVANITAQVPNLVGSFYASDYSYINDLEGTIASASHVDLSSGYYIVDAAGDTWAKSSATEKILINNAWVEDNSKSATFVQYNSAGVETGKSAVIAHDLQLDSLNGSAITFTNTATAESFTGTLHTNGLNVMDAWAYAGLNTTAGRANAEAAIQTAISRIDVQRVILQSKLSRATFDLGLAQVTSGGGGDKISSLNQQQLLDMQEISSKSARNELASSMAIRISNSRLNGYLSIMGRGSVGNVISLTA